MLVDREFAIAELMRFLPLETAAGGSPRGKLVTVAGPVAIGKTTLLDMFGARAVGAGAGFRRVAAVPDDALVPLGVLCRLLGVRSLPVDRTGCLPEHRWQEIVEGLPGPTVLALDDAHHADAASLRALYSLAGRTSGSARLLVVLAGQGDLRSSVPVLQVPPPDELVCWKVWLDPLTESGVRELMERRFGPETAERLAPAVHAVSGGNPRLVLGLAEDIEAGGGLGPSGSPGPLEPMVSDGYRKAVLDCLERCGPKAVRVAHGLAVLEEGSTPGRLRRLVKVDTDCLIDKVRRLNHAGILASGRFRHAVARQAVLGDIAPQEWADLHAAAATLLYQEGEAPTAIARHLLAARWAGSAWAVSTLHEVADLSICEGDFEQALEQLELAARFAADARQRAVGTALRVRLEWRTDPSAAARRIPELATAIAKGLLDDRRTLDAINLLLWFGHDRVAGAALERLGGTAGSPPSPVAEQVRAAHSWLARCYPGIAARVRTPAPAGAPGGPLEPVAVTTRTTALLTRLRATDRTALERIADAEQILSVSALSDERTLAPTLSALTFLVISERPDTADFWSDVLLSEASITGTTPWRALFTAVKANLAMRRGDLGQARIHAQAALAGAAAPVWGVGIGWPLSVLVKVDTLTGRTEQAAGHLRRPVPEAMFRTPVGLSYLQARGRHLHATGRHQAALDDFETAGRLMRRWRMDFPTMIPWRTDAAQALLDLGRVPEARELAQEQLAKVGDSVITARAAALRVLAACSDPAQAAELLGEAVGAMQAGGDQLELAHVLADLGRVQHRLGRIPQARLMRRRAEFIASQSGTDQPLDTLFPPVADCPREEVRSADGELVELSRAERRVAALAARGHTNRQIAESLSITASTVEQHLTRVYRKLKVRSRAHLPVTLGR